MMNFSTLPPEYLTLLCTFGKILNKMASTKVRTNWKRGKHCQILKHLLHYPCPVIKGGDEKCVKTS
jgi:hypothetical protein